MRNIKIIGFIIILALIIGMFLLPGISSPPAQVSILPSNQTFVKGETFELGIFIDPMGNYIAGAQLDLAFDRDMLKVNKITEGNFFKQNGANTYFNSGILNDSDGTVTIIYDAIIGNSNVSKPDIFIYINLTVLNSSGFSGINISNVEISDPNGFLIAANVTNGSIITTTTMFPTLRFINGTVIDHSLKTGIPGVIVFTGTNDYTMTNESGFYSFAFMEGTYDLTAKFDPEYYVNNTITVSTIGSEVVVQDIELIKKPTGTITGKIMKS